MRARRIAHARCLSIIAVTASSCSLLSSSTSDDVTLPVVPPAVVAESRDFQGSDSDIVMRNFDDTLSEQDLGQPCESIIAELDAEVDRAALLDAIAESTDDVLIELYLNLDAAVASGLAECDGALSDATRSEIEAGLDLIAARRSQLGLDS